MGTIVAVGVGEIVGVGGNVGTADGKAVAVASEERSMKPS